MYKKTCTTMGGAFVGISFILLSMPMALGERSTDVKGQSLNDQRILEEHNARLLYQRRLAMVENLMRFTGEDTAVVSRGREQRRLKPKPALERAKEKQAQEFERLIEDGLAAAWKAAVKHDCTKARKKLEARKRLMKAKVYAKYQAAVQAGCI